MKKTPLKVFNKFKVRVGIVGIFILTGAILGVYKLEQKQVQLTSLSNLDLTANWKTYTNEKYGFAFKYPSDFSLQTQRDLIVTGEPYIFVTLSNTEDEDYPVFNVVLVKTAMTLEEWMKNKDYCPESFISCTPIKAGPIPESIQFDAINRHYGGIDTLVKNNGILFDFSLGVRVPNKPIEDSVRDIYNLMLSTFRFLE